MRSLLGIVVLIAGVAGLGLWGRSHQAHQIERTISTAATAAAAGAVHGVTTRVSGRDITVTGLADTEAEKQTILAALNAVEGRRVVNDLLTVLPVASPYTLSLSKEAGKSDLGASGNVPTEAARAELAASLGGDASALVLASGAPAGWIDLAKAAVAALGPLNFGQAVVTDDALKIVGQAQTPVEAEAARAALAGLPEGAATAELSLVDDGKPAIWTLDYAAAHGAVVTGKLPRGLDVPAIAAALGLRSATDEAQHAQIGPEAGVGPLAALLRWLPDLESLRATVTPEGTEIVAGVGAGADLDLIGQGIAADLAATGASNVAFRLEQVAAEGADGTHRTNAATGEEEMLSGGYWLPVLRIAPSVEACRQAADDILARQTINFLSGSDRLDATARGVISRLASVVLPCTRDGGLKALVGGHTDSTGDAGLNLGLSQRRATAVRLALVARGIPGPALRAQGYGDSRPIAPNDTEEGKAANRRTTIEWSE